MILGPVSSAGTTVSDPVVFVTTSASVAYEAAVSLVAFRSPNA